MRALVLCLALLLAAAPVTAQTIEDCGEGFHQFDFWLGQWNVTDQPGTSTQGASSITSVTSGCTIREQWTSGGGKGYSLNMYDPQRDDWTQVWMDDSGLELHLVGGLVNGAMVLSGTIGVQLQRVTWTPLDAGRVRQHWEVSNNGGTSWITSFDGYYNPL